MPRDGCGSTKGKNTHVGTTARGCRCPKGFKPAPPGAGKPGGKQGDTHQVPHVGPHRVVEGQRVRLAADVPLHPPLHLLLLQPVHLQAHGERLRFGRPDGQTDRAQLLVGSEPGN